MSERNWDLTILHREEKRIDSFVWQMPVVLDNKRITVRLRANCSSFSFLWSSSPLSEQDQKQICDDVADWFWG